jgi:hypothetical protein
MPLFNTPTWTTKCTCLDDVVDADFRSAVEWIEDRNFVHKLGSRKK